MKQIEGIRQHYKDNRLVVFAHSYGTYALARILLENPYLSFDRVILCGSIIPETFDWSRVEEQILSSNKRDAIINECGVRDVWPVIARSATWGYGASGTFGFGSFNVRDRFHPISHSGFVEIEFVKEYWLPVIAGDAISPTSTDRSAETSPAWFAIFRLPIRWLVILTGAFGFFGILGKPPMLFPTSTPKLISTSGQQSPVVEGTRGDVRIEYGKSSETQK